MPKVKQHKARTDIYNKGARIPDDKTKTGYRVDRSKPYDEKDTLFCPKGTTYYQWGMMVGGRGVQRYSLTPPRRSQLTNSEFLGAIYDIEDGVDWSQCQSAEDLQAERDRIVDELRSLGSEQEDKHSNMPDNLQYSSTAELLETRAQACEDIAGEFEDVDLDYDEPDEGELKDEIDESEEDPEAKLEELKQEHLDEWLDEKRGELDSVDWNYE